MAKGLYRAPSNLPELLVVMLCKRPHFVTIAPAGGRSPLLCYASRHGAEKLRSTLSRRRARRYVAVRLTPRSERPSSTFSRPDKIVPYVSAVHFRNYADDIPPNVGLVRAFPRKYETPLRPADSFILCCPASYNTPRCSEASNGIGTMSS